MLLTYSYKKLHNAPICLGRFFDVGLAIHPCFNFYTIRWSHFTYDPLDLIRTLGTTFCLANHTNSDPTTLRSVSNLWTHLIFSNRTIINVSNNRYDQHLPIWPLVQPTSIVMSHFVIILPLCSQNISIPGSKSNPFNFNHHYCYE